MTQSNYHSDDDRSFLTRLHQLDPGLFAPVLSQTTIEDRHALLSLQLLARAHGRYVCLEIGSYLGGSLQPHVADPACARIWSLDRRVALPPDERRMAFPYAPHSGAAMVAELRATFGDAAGKITAFDGGTEDVAPAAITDAPDFCFIDGEHTPAAAERDFTFCRRVAAPDAIIVFHDAHLVYRGIARCEARLRADGVEFAAIKLTGCVYALVLGPAAAARARELAPVTRATWWFWLTSPLFLRVLRVWLPLRHSEFTRAAGRFVRSFRR